MIRTFSTVARTRLVSVARLTPRQSLATIRVFAPRRPALLLCPRRALSQNTAEEEKKQTAVVETTEAKSNAGTDDHTAPARSFKEALVSLKDQLFSPVGIAVIGGVVSLYLGWKILQFMTHVSFAGIGEYAFVIGIGCGAGLALGGVWFARLFSRRPEYVYNRTLSMVKRSERATVFMGGHNIYGGNFKAFHTIPLSTVGPKEEWNLPAEWRGLSAVNKFFKPCAFHLMFTVQAKDKISMVSAELIKQGNHYGYQSLYLTSLPSGERLLLEGEDKLIYEKTISFAVSD